MDQNKDKEAVEKKAAEDAVAAEAIKKEEAAKVAAAAEVPDLVDELDAALKTIEQVSAERDNYKRVALAKKRGKDDEGGEQLTEEEVERRANERAGQIADDRKSKEAEEAKRKELAEKLRLAKENRELRTALKNRNGISNAPAGGAQPDKKPAGTDTSFFSEDQLKVLQQMQKNMPPGVKLDPKKIEEMHRRRMGR